MRHLDQLHAGDRLQQLTRLFIDVVVVGPTESARVVVGDLALLLPLQQGRELLQMFDQELGVVSDGEGEALGGVLVLEDVVGVGIRGHDFVELIPADGLAVLLGQQLEQASLAGQTLDIAVAVLVRPEDAETDPQCLEDPGHCLADRLDPRVIRGVVTDEPQHVDRFLGLGHDRHRHGEVAGPRGTPARRFPECVAVAARVLQRGLQLGRDLALTSISVFSLARSPVVRGIWAGQTAVQAKQDMHSQIISLSRTGSRSSARSAAMSARGG